MAGYINLPRWKHREHFEFFRGFAHPLFSVCADVDVTGAWARSREPAGPSFFLAGLHAASLAADAVEAVRLRIHGDRVYCHDHVRMSTTVLRADGTFGYARLPYAPDFLEFADLAQPVISAVRSSQGLPLPGHEDDVVYHSTLPWLRFTAFSNAVRTYDSIPRLVFGRCTPGGRGMVMPVALEVHHAVAHGLDVAKFYERLEALLAV
jgi:chloramphenicol O-acetyltransferase type A